MNHEPRHSLRERAKRHNLYVEATSLPPKNIFHSVSKPKACSSPKEIVNSTKQHTLDAKLLVKLVSSLNRYYYEDQKRRKQTNEAPTKSEKQDKSLIKSQLNDKKAESPNMKKKQVKKNGQKLNEKSFVGNKEPNSRSPKYKHNRERPTSPSETSTKSFGLFQSKERIRKCIFHVAIAYNIFLTKQFRKGAVSDMNSLDPTSPARLLKLSADAQKFQQK